MPATLDGMVWRSDVLEDDRIEIVKQCLFEHMKNPSPRHIKDPYVLIKLAQEIAKKLDRGNSL